MNEETWSSVDRYITDLFVAEDTVLSSVLEASAAADLPEIQVSAAQGKLLHLLARAVGARRILELDTLGGYSTIWLARALAPDGRLITLEADPHHAQVAQENIRRANLDRIVEIRVGPAIESLPQLFQESAGPFDFIFLDADKESYPDYLPWLIRLARPGTMIVSDNLIRNGAVIDPESSDPRVQGVRTFNELLAADSRLDSTIIQTVGAKGYDGFALTIVP